jgi:hypothetical protein
MFHTFIEKLKGVKRSLTIWINSVFAVIVLILPEAQMSFPAMQEYIPHDVYRWLMAVTIAANMILRFKTVADLKDKA